MKTTITVLTATLVVLSVGYVADAGIIASAVNPTNNHIYHLLTPHAYNDAEAEAITLGGHLATVRDIAEHDFIWTTFGSGSVYNKGTLWIGINDIASECVFVWTSGELVVFTNWDTNEPSNSWGNEDWGAMWRQGRWNDFGPGSPEGTIYNGVAEVVPEPATLGLLAFGALGLLRRKCDRGV